MSTSCRQLADIKTPTISEKFPIDKKIICSYLKATALAATVCRNQLADHAYWPTLRLLD